MSDILLVGWFAIWTLVFVAMAYEYGHHKGYVKGLTDARDVMRDVWRKK